MTALYPLAAFFEESMIAAGAEDVMHAGIGLNGYVSVLAIGVVGFAVADLIFFPIYYKNGKSIVMSTLFTILGFVVYLGIFTVALPYIPGMEWYVDILCNRGIGVQFAILAGAILTSFGMNTRPKPLARPLEW